MKHNYKCTYKRITLVPLEETHIENLRVLRNKNRECFVFSGIIEPEAQKKWYSDYLNKDDDLAFSILYNNKWIGSVSLYSICENKAEFGRLLIDKEATGVGGLGLEATLGLCKLAFDQLKINEIILQVYKSNIAAYKTYLKAGFTKVDEITDAHGQSLINMTLCNKAIDI